MTASIPWSPALQAARTKNHSASSGSPVTFSAIAAAPDIYTHAGRANQYGSGRRNGRSVRVLIVHETEGGDLDDDQADFVASMQYEAYRAEDVSCTCLIGRSGDVGYDVPEADRPFTTGRWNDESLTIEVDGRGSWTREQWLEAPDQIAAVEEVLVDWCRRYEIPPVWLDAGAVADGASRQSATPKQGVNRGITDHRTANKAAIALGGDPATYSHTCPGDAFHELLIDTIVPNVAARLSVVTEPDLPPTPSPTEDLMPALVVAKPVVDTRSGRPIASIPAKTPCWLPAGLPADATSAQVHVFVTGAAGAGFLGFYDGAGEPASATINFDPAHGFDQVGALVPVRHATAGGEGGFVVWSTHACQLLVDLQGLAA